MCEGVGASLCGGDWKEKKPKIIGRFRLARLGTLELLGSEKNKGPLRQRPHGKKPKKQP